MAVKEKIRIRLKGYDHQLVDQSAERIVATAKRTGVSFFSQFFIFYKVYCQKMAKAPLTTYKNKKDVRPIVLRPRILGIAKRPNRMNYEETIFPRRGYTQQLCAERT